MNMAIDQTKNDIAWNSLFEKYNILLEVDTKGFFEIESAQINEVRESRLMAKFDHFVNLPKIFRDNNLSILPVSRSRYIIGHFDAYCKINEGDIDPIIVPFPSELESIDITNLYSESSALHCAFNLGIIDDLWGEKTRYTVSGRMSTGSFDFNIKNCENSEHYPITVDKSQCEIDGGFESENYFLILEAKNYSIDDFLIRQLYYPYRLWSNKISKKVIPIFMTYSNDRFSFFIYEFEDQLDYNSIKLIGHKDYIISSEEIQKIDIDNLFKSIRCQPESEVPFPQSDKFERVIDLLSLLMEKDLTTDEITANYQFNVRQTGYYTNAGRYLSLIEKYTNPLTKEITFRLTEDGKAILKKSHKLKSLGFISKILEHEVFYKAFELTINNGVMPETSEICDIISENCTAISESTISRRASSVKAWINWIWEQIQD